MKIAYLSSYRDNTEIALAAISNILACEEAGFDVVCRPVSILAPSTKVACPVEHLERKDLRNVDVIIQHTIPNLFEYKNGVRNIGCFGFDTHTFSRSPWSRCCNLMDDIIVPSNMCYQSTIGNGVNKPVHVVPYACHYDKFQHPPEPLKLPQLKDKCVFYVIGEFNRCNNFAALLRAYYAAFSSRDSVVLVIKANIPGKAPSFANSMIKNMTMDIKKSTHLYANEHIYPPVIAIADDLSQEQLDRLHCACDIFVHPARGASFGAHAYHAMGFGKPVILSRCGAYKDLVDNQTGWSIPGQLSPCFGMTDVASDLYTGADFWFEPDLEILIESLKKAYAEWQTGLLRHSMGQAASTKIANITSKHTGQLFKNILKGDNHGVDICDDIARCQPSVG